jgi:hypothetical protein
MQGCSDQFGPSTSETVELKAGIDAAQDLSISSDFPKAAEASCNIDSSTDSPVPRRPHEYTGALMSFDLKGDIRNFFRSISMISGVELDVDKSINRSIAVHLANIPWDLALDVVLRTSGLGSDLDGKVLRIGTADPALGQDRVLMGTVTIAGTIAEVNLQNPRMQLRVNAPNADGTMQIWSVEWESADYLKGIGISPDTLKSGNKVIITGNVTRENTVRLISIQRPSDNFFWGYGYVGSVRSAISAGVMFVGSAPQ